MASVKVKTKIPKNSMLDGDMNNIFNTIVGSGPDGKSEAPLYIVYPKYIEIKKVAEKFIKLITIFHNETNFIPLFPDEKAMLEEYLNVIKSSYDQIFNVPDFDQWIAPSKLTMEEALDDKKKYLKVDPAAVEIFKKSYPKVKKSIIVSSLLEIGADLSDNKSSIEDKSTLSDLFIVNAPGNLFTPFKMMPNFNFKKLYIDSRVTIVDKQFMLTILHKVYTFACEMYEKINIPDVDIDEFVTLINRSADVVEKQLPGCKKAFSKIKNSSGLLKSNFGDYYKNFTETDNSSTIIEGYIRDISQQDDVDMKTAAQLQRIMQYYRKMSAKNNVKYNPQIQNMMAQMDKTMSSLDEKLSEVVDEDTVDNSDLDSLVDGHVAEMSARRAAHEASTSNPMAEQDDDTTSVSTYTDESVPETPPRTLPPGAAEER